jgi:single-strand DNA-binding protein
LTQAINAGRRQRLCGAGAVPTWHHHEPLEAIVINQVTLLGNVGQDPEVRSLHSGDPVASFSLATSEAWKDKDSGERRERTEWHRVVVFNPTLAEVVREHVIKGSRIYVQGQIRNRKYEKDGHDVYVTEIVLDRVGAVLRLLGDPKGNGGSKSEPRRDEHDTRDQGRTSRSRSDSTSSDRRPTASSRQPAGRDEEHYPDKEERTNGNNRRRARIPDPIEDDEIPF